MRIRSTFNTNDKPICLTQAIKLNQNAKIFTALVRRHLTSSDTMQSLLSYTSVIGEEHTVLSLNVGIMHVADDVEPKNFLPASF